MQVPHPSPRPVTYLAARLPIRVGQRSLALPIVELVITAAQSITADEGGSTRVGRRLSYFRHQTKWTRHEFGPTPSQESRERPNSCTCPTALGNATVLDGAVNLTE